jgi:hypothetical protein
VSLAARFKNGRLDNKSKEDKMKKIALAVIPIISILGYASFPKVAPFITERKNAEKIDLSKNGLIAFTYKANSANSSISVDMRNLNSKQVYRVEFNKPFSNEITVMGVEVLENLAKKDVISDSIAMFELPEGKYLPFRNVYYKTQHEQGSQKADGKEFSVIKGKITSFGEVEINFDRKLFSGSTMKIGSNSKSIKSAIANVDDPRIKRLEIIEQEFSSNAE